MAWEPLTPLLELGGKLIDKLIPDPEARAKAQYDLFKLHQDGQLAVLAQETNLALGQIEVNKIEAASDSFFKSGWRPATGWTCVAGLIYQLVFRPMFGWMATNALGWTAPPSLEVETLMTLLFGLLGLGAYRTMEKVKVMPR